MTYKDWCAQKCEWCRSGLPMSFESGKHYRPDPGEIFNDLAGERISCTAGDRDAFESELSTELAAAKERVRELEKLWESAKVGAEKMGHAINSGVTNEEALERTVASQAEEIAGLKDWVKAANQFAWAHEHYCKRNTTGDSCTCELESFLSRPRPFVESYKQQIASQAEEIAELMRLAQEAEELSVSTNQRFIDDRCSALARIASQAAVIEKAREALEAAYSSTKITKNINKLIRPVWSDAMGPIRKQIKAALALLSSPQPSTPAEQPKGTTE